MKQFRLKNPFLSPFPPLDSANANFAPPKSDGRDGQTPKLSGVDLDAPSAQRAGPSTQEGKGLDELETKRSRGSEFYAQPRFWGWEEVGNIELAGEESDPAARSPVLG